MCIVITVKQFWTFEYLDYYPSGGMNAHVGSFDTLEEAIKSFEKFDWICNTQEVYDVKDSKVVWANGEYK
jgi:hypothetical protein